MKRWFTLDDNGNGLEFYLTAEDAERAAKEYMQEALEELGIDGIINEQICWGELVIKGSLEVENGQAIMADVTE